MCQSETHTKLIVNAKREVDPSRTVTLRNAFVRNSNKRFKALSRLVTEVVVQEDVFGLKPTLNVFQTGLEPQAFAFLRTEEKIEAFMKWIREQQAKGVLELTYGNQIGTSLQQPWTNMYVSDAYKRGIIRARAELRKAGMNIPTIDLLDMQSVLNPFHIERLGVLYTRVFNELEGVTAMMDTQISRILTEGLLKGESPIRLARQINSAIIDVANRDALGLDISYINRNGTEVKYFMSGRRRAEILARTEIIRAHHQAMVQEYRNWGVEGVVVLAEWMTAGDNRVCTRCSNMEGSIYTLDQIETMIPLHAQCRCVALPWIESNQNL